MPEACASCGARLRGEVPYCTQCFTPVDHRAAPVPAGVGAGPAPFGSVGWAAGPARPDRQASASPPVGPAPPGLGSRPIDPAPPLLSRWATPGATAVAAEVRGPAMPGPSHAGPVDGRAIRTAAAVIGLGLVFQLVIYALGRMGTVEPSRAIQINLYGTVAFYIGVALIVVAQAQQVDFRPVWTDGDPTRSGLIGAVTGVCVAAGLMTISSVLSGTVQVDQRIAQIVSERSLARVLAALLIAVVAAPMVEELLFRGLVVESLRSKGRRAAVLVGAVLFSAWHLNPSAFPYYVAMGVLLGTLYWRWGMKSSVAAHAAFNGTITAVAVVMAFGSHTITTPTVSVAVPGGWHQVSSVQAGLGGLGPDLVLSGPSGAGMVVVHQQIPAGVTVDLQAVADRWAGGTTPMAGLDGASVPRLVHLPSGPGLRMSVRYHGHEGALVVERTDASLWTVILFSGGSGTATNDFDAIVGHLTLHDPQLGSP